MGHPEYLKLLDEMRALHVQKAADYGRGADPFANVRASAEFGMPAWVGVMVRANDKMHRVKSFVQNGNLKNESVEDSLKDLAAYALIALVLYREEQAKPRDFLMGHCDDGSPVYACDAPPIGPAPKFADAPASSLCPICGYWAQVGGDWNDPHHPNCPDRPAPKPADGPQKSDRPRVYIAGPISKGDLAHNIDQATAAFVTLAKAGLAPFCPHWSAYSKPTYKVLRDGAVRCVATVNGNAEMQHADWLGVDLSWVEVADAVLRLPGVSTGADMETERAKEKGIPVFTTADEVIAWSRQPS